MNSDDEKRLAEIRARMIQRGEHCVSTARGDCSFLLARLDESKRARKTADESAVRALLAARERAEKAEAALAEERAKREAAEATCIMCCEDGARLAAGSLQRAEAAEARVAELEARIAGLEK